MRKSVFSIGILLIFLTLNFSGCEEIGMKPDYITVIVDVWAYVNLVNPDDTILQENVKGPQMTIFMQKDRGQQFTFERNTTLGYCMAIGTFKLYREQFIECTATVQGGYKDFYPLAPAYKMLSWEDVYPSHDFGEEYTWRINLVVLMKNNTIVPP